MNVKSTLKIVAPTVTLEMSLKQAYYLHRVLDNVSGQPSGPRGEMDEINDALNQHREAYRQAGLIGFDPIRSGCVNMVGIEPSLKS